MMQPSRDARQAPGTAWERAPEQYDECQGACGAGGRKNTGVAVLGGQLVGVVAWEATTAWVCSEFGFMSRRVAELWLTDSFFHVK